MWIWNVIKVSNNFSVSLAKYRTLKCIICLVFDLLSRIVILPSNDLSLAIAYEFNTKRQITASFKPVTRPKLWRTPRSSLFCFFSFYSFRLGFDSNFFPNYIVRILISVSALNKRRRRNSVPGSYTWFIKSDFRDSGFECLRGYLSSPCYREKCIIIRTNYSLGIRNINAYLRCAAKKRHIPPSVSLKKF